MNIAITKKNPIVKFAVISSLALAFIGSTVHAGSATAYVNTGQTYAEGGTANTSVGSGSLKVSSSGPTYSMIGKVHKFVAIYPDPVIKTMSAGPAKEVKGYWSSSPGTFYPSATTQYNVKTISGGATLTTNP
ncbi:hypothetical protein G9298_28555 (plasmid) [Bacillus thuringiensis]|uniref:hypothetical protein n=1 Tax=Bacillus wiedmannii TaxID=1890302 RepID=UPI000D094C80|nr:hypothetical protein [Bacillus wiedmannii]PRT15841.1 hypothetical protein C6360_27340 [Bacillus wiedmannii]QPW51623.1 hypothetical protein G9298_28555 [Bacillus thuringiensis]